MMQFILVVAYTLLGPSVFAADPVAEQLKAEMAAQLAPAGRAQAEKRYPPACREADKGKYDHEKYVRSSFAIVSEMSRLQTKYTEPRSSLDCQKAVPFKGCYSTLQRELTAVIDKIETNSTLFVVGAALGISVVINDKESRLKSGTPKDTAMVTGLLDTLDLQASMLGRLKAFRPKLCLDQVNKEEALTGLKKLTEKTVQNLAGLKLSPAESARFRDLTARIIADFPEAPPRSPATSNEPPQAKDK